MTENQHLVIDYASPATGAIQRRERRKRMWARVRALALLMLFLFWVSLFLPIPRGRWYVGHRSQWIVAIDGAGLTLGPTDRASVVLGVAPLVTIELLVLCLPTWLIATLLRRRGVSDVFTRVNGPERSSGR